MGFNSFSSCPSLALLSLCSPCSRPPLNLRGVSLLFSITSESGRLHERPHVCWPVVYSWKCVPLDGPVVRCVLRLCQGTSAKFWDVLHPSTCWSYIDRLFALENAIPVQQCWDICQGKDLSVLSYLFPSLDAPSDLYDCTVWVGTSSRGDARATCFDCDHQYPAGFHQFPSGRTCSVSCLRLFDAVFALFSFVNVQAKSVKITEHLSPD